MLTKPLPIQLPDLLRQWSGDTLRHRMGFSTELENKYEGSTVTTGALIYEMFNLPEEMQILPVYFALAHYYAVKKDTNQESKYLTLYTASLASGKVRYGTKSRSALTRGSAFVSRWQAWSPPFFPQSAT